MDINSLPSKVLRRIFSYLSTTEQNKLENVCQAWKGIMDSLQSTVLVIGDLKGLNTKKTTNLSRNQVAEIYSQCVDALRNLENDMERNCMKVEGSGDFSHGSSNELMTQDEVETKLFSKELKNLGFIGALPQQIFPLVLKHYNTLFAIHFNLSALAKIQLEPSLKLKMDIPTLKTLVIESSGLKDTWKQRADEFGEIPGNFYDMGKILNVVVAMLNSNMFPHLLRFVLDIPMCREKENSIVTTISEFLVRHKSTLEDFCYHQGFIVHLREGGNEVGANDSGTTDAGDNEDDYENVEDSDSDENNNDNNEEHSCTEEDKVSLESMAACSKLLKQVFLKNLHIGLYKSQDSDPVWKNLLLHQNRLEKIIFTGDRIPFLSRTLELNAPKLTVITLETRDLLNLSVLKHCSKLRKLSILSERDDVQFEAYNIGDAKSVLGVEYLQGLLDLPSSIELLRIHGMSMNCIEFNHIVTSRTWNKLVGVEIVNCGREGMHGVALRTIANIISQKRLQWFHFDNTINRLSLSDRELPEEAMLLAFALKQNSLHDFNLRGRLLKGNYVFNRELASTHYWLRDGVFEFPEEIYPVGAHRLIDEDESSQEVSTDDEEQESCNDEDFENLSENEDDDMDVD